MGSAEVAVAVGVTWCARCVIIIDDDERCRSLVDFVRHRTETIVCLGHDVTCNVSEILQTDRYLWQRETGMSSQYNKRNEANERQP